MTLPLIAPPGWTSFGGTMEEPDVYLQRRTGDGLVVVVMSDGWGDYLIDGLTVEGLRAVRDAAEGIAERHGGWENPISPPEARL